MSLSLDCSHIDYNQIIDINSFVRLRSLSLIYIKDEQLQKLSQLSLNNLRRIRLNSMQREFIVKTFPHDKTKNHIENVTLDGRIKLAKLFRLWSFLRNDID